RARRERASGAALLFGQFAGFYFIHVAPHPALSWLDGAHQRMPNTAIVFSCVFILGGIAAPHVTTAQAQAQMHPVIAGLNAVLANVFAGIREFYLVKMRALGCHGASYLSLPESVAGTSKKHTPFANFPKRHCTAAPMMFSDSSTASKTHWMLLRRFRFWR